MSNELDVIKFDLKQIQIELRETRREKSVFTKFFSNLKKEKKEIIKGTEELAEEQAKEEEKEKIKRKKILRRFAYKNKTDKKNKEESVSHPKLGFD